MYQVCTKLAIPMNSQIFMVSLRKKPVALGFFFASSTVRQTRKSSATEPEGAFLSPAAIGRLGGEDRRGRKSRCLPPPLVAAKAKAIVGVSARESICQENATLLTFPGGSKLSPFLAYNPLSPIFFLSSRTWSLTLVTTSRFIRDYMDTLPADQLATECRAMPLPLVRLLDSAILP